MFIITQIIDSPRRKTCFRSLKIIPKISLGLFHPYLGDCKGNQCQHCFLLFQQRQILIEIIVKIIVCRFEPFLLKTTPYMTNIHFFIFYLSPLSFSHFCDNISPILSNEIWDKYKKTPKGKLFLRRLQSKKKGTLL